jgi:large subunit ribosomal protein L24
MKQKFSTSWIGSRQPRKQRKFRANAPIHMRHKLLSVNLSKELRKKYSKRNFPIRKGDNVKILVGEFKKKTGKISAVNTKRLKVLIDGIYKSKKDGTKVKVYFDPSNLQIQELNLEDKKRIEAIQRKAQEKKETVKKEEKAIVKKIEKIKKPNKTKQETKK